MAIAPSARDFPLVVGTCSAERAHVPTGISGVNAAAGKELDNEEYGHLHRTECGGGVHGGARTREPRTVAGGCT
jgi:hypothetical protein